MPLAACGYCAGGPRFRRAGYEVKLTPPAVPCQQSGVDDPNFAYELLSELTRTFLAYADDVRAQDSAAYAMQVQEHARRR